LVDRLRRFACTPKALLVGILLVLVAVTAPWTSSGAGKAWLTVAVAAGTAAALDVVLTMARGWRRRVPDGAMGTGVLLGMILDPSLPLLTVAAVAAGAVAVKHLVRTRRGHVFNPASIALVAAGLVGVSAQSWWGVAGAPSYVIVPLIILAGLFLADRVNRLPMAGAFFGTYATLLIFTLFMLAVFTGTAGRIADAYQEPFVNAALLLGLVMLTDPPTSPGRLVDQCVYGLLSAIVSVAGLLAGLVYFLPLGLAAGNVWVAIKRRRQRTAPSSTHRAAGRTKPVS
jgi:Na+-transporting NADH:ubiquinone oxidoreductase subunit NqrB